LQAISVVILTSSREEKDLLRSYKNGVKPVSFKEFITAIQDLGVLLGPLERTTSRQPPTETLMLGLRIA